MDERRHVLALKSIGGFTVGVFQGLDFQYFHSSAHGNSSEGGVIRATCRGEAEGGSRDYGGHKGVVSGGAKNELAPVAPGGKYEAGQNVVFRPDK